MADLTARPGQTIEVDFGVENTGAFEDTQDIFLVSENGDPVNVDVVENITLEGGAGTSDTMFWEDVTEGEYTLCVQSDDTVDCISVNVSDIPDSVVSRDPDNNSNEQDTKYGIQFTVSQEWPEFGAELSQNDGGDSTRAYIYRVSDGLLMGDVDITNLTAGDTFTIDLDISLSAGETYNIVADAEGATYTHGFDDAPSFPYTANDGNLEIINGAVGESGTTDKAIAFLTIGNVGFA